MLTKHLTSLLVLVAATFVVGAVQPQVYSTDQIQVELIAEPLEVVPG